MLKLLIIAVIFGCSPRAVAEPQPWRVSVQLQYFHQFQFAGFYAAQKRGLYSKAGLQVDLLEGTPATDAVTAVLRGDAAFGVADTEPLWRRLDGDPLVALGVIFQNSAFGLVSLSSSHIMTSNDLRGKRIGIASGRGGFLFRALFAKQGLPPQSYTLITPKWNLQSLLDGEVDSNAAYATGELYRLRELNLAYNVMSPSDYGLDFYGDTLFTSEAYQARYPKVVESFRQATFAGWRYAFDHEEELIDYILTLGSVRAARISRERLKFEATAMRHLILPDIIELGSMQEQRWAAMAKMLIAVDQHPSMHIERLSGFVYDTPRARRESMLRYAVVAGTLCLVLLIAALLWVRQLRKSVRERTVQLSQSTLLAEQRTAEAKAANTAKSLFLGGISHEFRTPLTAILGFADLLKGSELQPQQKAWVGIVHDRAADLLTLVNRIMEFVQVDRPEVEVRIHDFDLCEQVDAVAATFQPMLKDKGVHFTVKMAPQLPLWVRGADLPLRQVLFNLIGNAIKFVPQGGHIVLTCVPGPEHPPMPADCGSRFLFTVEDDGPGIPEAIADAVFEPFFSGRQGGPPQPGGLGLSICKKLVASLAGELWFSNTEPSGCRFCFTAAFATPLMARQRPTRAAPRILVVDDEANNRELIQIHLERAGMQMCEAENGRAAIARCTEEVFDFIVMDLGLPDLDGKATTREILTLAASKNRRTPVAALTASSAISDREQCLAVGMCAFLTKPIDFKQLLATIREALEGTT